MKLVHIVVNYRKKQKEKQKRKEKEIEQKKTKITKMINYSKAKRNN